MPDHPSLAAHASFWHAAIAVETISFSPTILNSIIDVLLHQARNAHLLKSCPAEACLGLLNLLTHRDGARIVNHLSSY